ncbi:MAG: hypothetical protein VYA91_14320 [Pseudomonadota bacterium]|nr:hypothetical protein [Pseudomonadota bacterium]
MDASKCKHCKSEVEPLGFLERQALIKAKEKEGHVPYPVVFAVIGCAIWFSFWLGGDSVTGTVKANVNASPEKSLHFFVKGPAIGCKTQEDYKRGFNILINEEWEALAHMVASGRCTTLKDSTKIFIEDSTFSMAKIRVSGSTSAYWTGIEVPEER